MFICDSSFSQVCEKSKSLNIFRQSIIFQAKYSGCYTSRAGSVVVLKLKQCVTKKTRKRKCKKKEVSLGLLRDSILLINTSTLSFSWNCDLFYSFSCDYYLLSSMHDSQLGTIPTEKTRGKDFSRVVILVEVLVVVQAIWTH